MKNASAAAAYARAFLQAADAQNSSDKLLPQVAALAAVFAASEKQLADPRRSPAARRALVKGISAKLKLPGLLANLLQLLADNKRLGEAGAVLAEVVHLANKRAGRAEVRLESAVPFTPEQLNGLKLLLKKKLAANDVLVNEISAPGLIGGFRAFAGGGVWDCSVRGRLTALAARFASAIEK